MKKYIILILLLALIVPTFSQNTDQGTDVKEVLKPALLIIDVQKTFLKWMSEEDINTAIPFINYAIYIFRKNNLPVILVYHTDQEWGPAPGTAGFAFHDSLNIEKSDPVVVKTYGDAFNKTDLNSLLTELGCNTLYLCGLSANGCVLATYFGAANNNYKAFLIKDALISPHQTITQSIENIFNAQNLNDIEYIFKHALR